MVQIIEENRKPSTLEKFGNAFSNLNKMAAQFMISKLEKEKQDKEDAALSKMTGQDFSSIRDPELRKRLLQGSIDDKNKASEFASKIQGNRNILRSIEKERNLETGSLEGYVNDPKMAEKATRPSKEPKKTQASQPIDPEQMKIIKEVRNSPGFDEMDDVDQYRAMTSAGVSKENAEVEAKLTGEKLKRSQQSNEASYKAQDEFIKDITQRYQGFETEIKPKLLQMQNMSDDDLIGPTQAVFLEELGIPLGALQDPSSELYNKLSLDLLKGLPETYGNRILKVEVENFLETIPRLSNSADGRRMIASNMLKLGEMKQVYYNEMRKQQIQALDNNKPFPRDFEQRVFDQVKPQIDRINNEFVKLSSIKSVPKDTVPYFGPDGNIMFVPKKNIQWAEKNEGKRIW